MICYPIWHFLYFYLAVLLSKPFFMYNQTYNQTISVKKGYISIQTIQDTIYFIFHCFLLPNHEFATYANKSNIWAIGCAWNEIIKWQIYWHQSPTSKKRCYGIDIVKMANVKCWRLLIVATICFMIYLFTQSWYAL